MVINKKTTGGRERRDDAARRSEGRVRQKDEDEEKVKE